MGNRGSYKLQAYPLYSHFWPTTFQHRRTYNVVLKNVSKLEDGGYIYILALNSPRNVCEE